VVRTRGMYKGKIAGCKTILKYLLYVANAARPKRVAKEARSEVNGRMRSTAPDYGDKRSACDACK
jgi:hypothetical protein